MSSGDDLNPSWSTISTLLNSMIGGVMLTMPLLFRDSGIGTGLILLLVSAALSYKTCVLYIIHMGEEQKDIEQTINRLAQRKWQSFFRGISGYYLVSLSLIYMELIEDQVYGIIFYILESTGHKDWIEPISSSNFVFTRFSVQYLAIACILPLLMLISIKNLAVLIRLTAVGVSSIIIYMVFIVYEFISKFQQIDWNKIVYFSGNFGNLAGTCALAFTVHTVVNPIIKANRHQKNNVRDLWISYVLGFLIYGGIGLMGSASIQNYKCDETIISCFEDSWQALLVYISYLFGLVTVFPCFFEVARERVLSFHFGKVQESMARKLNIIFIGIASTFVFFKHYIPLSLVMNLVGSFLCYFFVYLIPSKFHWNCLYKEMQVTTSLISQEPSEGQQINGKCAHAQDYVNNCPKKIRVVFYSLLNLLGIAVGLYAIYQFFFNIFSDSDEQDQPVSKFKHWTDLL